MRLGRPELQVTPIAYGTGRFGGEWGEGVEQPAIDSIRHAREPGANVEKGMAKRVQAWASPTDTSHATYATAASSSPGQEPG
ncbi:hypothetical protein [Actinomadura sp. HBU206391]|uniref:hypothetical protein n=1 Tax=Actinomadura sp. HBU206391 TaxID=2731692 RepID=UPI00164F3E76|nr:hypothetical protein [Actinomadura sp. HBU206391]MBC6463153.1 hypothetical protein [Actinomadura sp. HBU206391]